MNFLRLTFDFIMDILETVVFVGGIFMVIYLFIVQPNTIKGPSMEPTFYEGEYIFTSKITYKFRPFERGDVVVIKSPENPDIDFIKRVIGLPGDTLIFRDGEVFLNGVQLDEPYLAASTPLWNGGYAQEGVPIVVRPNEVFVMGDNRPQSLDSRKFGPLTSDAVLGHVFYRYFPTSKMGSVKNPFASELRRPKASLPTTITL